jgi:hypothetical protein
VGRQWRGLRDGSLLTSETPDLARYDAGAARRIDAGDACAAADGAFGAGNYDDLAGLPDAVVRVSVGCGATRCASTRRRTRT